MHVWARVQGVPGNLHSVDVPGQEREQRCALLQAILLEEKVHDGLQAATLWMA